MDPELIKGTLTLLVLKLVSRRPLYGYAIAETVREYTDGAFSWTEGSLYPCLHKLESAGLIDSRWEGDPGTRRRKYYAITPAGRKVLAAENR